MYYSAMDNLTHSVIGLAIGELVQRSVAPEPSEARQRTRRRLLLTSGWAASNFPDLDLVFTGLLPAPLGYLLHHRGHTHTLLYLLPQAVLLFALLWLLWPAARVLLRESRPARLALLASIGIGLVFHIVMDGLNSYGVHPFHPFDSGWLYGDLVFIVEPVFWVALGVPLAMAAPSRLARTVLLGLLAAVIVWASARGYLLWPSSLALILLGLVLALLQARAGPQRRVAIATGVAVALGYVGVQALASSAGKTQAIAQGEPHVRVLDVVMNGFPANPLCWNFIAVELLPAQASYKLRFGTLSLAPALLPAAACPAAFSGSSRQADYSMAELQRRFANCHFQAWMRFARVPHLDDTGASDARFSMQGGRNFSTLDYASVAAIPCPSSVPEWDMPRSDLLNAR